MQIKEKLCSLLASLKSRVRFKLFNQQVVRSRTLFILPNTGITFTPDLGKPSLAQILETFDYLDIL